MNIKYYLLLLFFTTSCATIFTGTSDPVQINSNPQGAEVYSKGNIYHGKTPTTVNINRSLSESNITLKKAGYSDTTVEVPHRFNKISILNLASPIGWAIDLITGAAYKNEKQVSAKLISENKK